MIEIKTERLILKNPSYSDKDRLINLIGDFRVSGKLSNVPYPYTEYDAHFWLKRVNKGKFNLGIFRGVSLIGGVGFSPKDNDVFELGYWLGVEYWGQGYATEACKALLQYASTKTLHSKFRANVARENIASARVLEKIGFRYVGEGYVFSLAKQKKISTLIYECFL